MLKKRLLSAFVLVSIAVIATILIPQAFFFPVALIATLLACYFSGVEYISLRWNTPYTTLAHAPPKEARAPELRKKHWLLGILYVLPLLAFVLDDGLYQSQGSIFALATIFMSVLGATFAIYLTNRNLSVAADRIISFIAGFVYITFASICFLKVITMPFDGAWIHSPGVYLLCGVIALGDSGAYFIGMRFGKRKIAPHISPRKSLEGSLGGLLFSVLGALAVNQLFHLDLPLLFTIAFGLIVGLAGQAGDLLESALKRGSGFKDSGCLLPGHGGMLDRFDSCLLGAPVAFIMLQIYFTVGHS